MGISKQARDDFSADVTAFKQTNTPTRAQVRKYVAALVDAGNEWLSKFDRQEAEAAQAVADSKPSQFSSFRDALPDVALDPAPTDPVDPQP